MTIPKKRTTRAVGAAIAVIVLGGYGVGRATADPELQIEANNVDVLAAPADSTDTSVPNQATPTTASSTQTIEGLARLEGVLIPGDDIDDWRIGGVDLDFGSDGWIATARPLGDFDNDGIDEAFRDELVGLTGQSVVLGVRYDPDDDDFDDADVFTIGSLTYRDPSGLPPWQIAIPDSGQPDASRADVATAAAAAVGPGAIVDDIDPDVDDGWSGWKVEVLDINGRDYDVLVDRAGNVVDVREDT